MFLKVGVRAEKALALAETSEMLLGKGTARKSWSIMCKSLQGTYRKDGRDSWPHKS